LATSAACAGLTTIVSALGQLTVMVTGGSADAVTGLPPLPPTGVAVATLVME